jgi:hypothetical protein
MSPSLQEYSQIKTAGFSLIYTTMQLTKWTAAERRRKIKDWLARNQDNMSQRSEMSTR